MSALKDRLQSDLTTSMKARDELRMATLRMALTAIRMEEVSGKSARELDDAEVMTVLTRETKKRREAAEAFDGGGRPDRADRERRARRLSAGAALRRRADRARSHGDRRDRRRGRTWHRDRDEGRVPADDGAR
jgi:Yqey-like protein